MRSVGLRGASVSAVVAVLASISAFPQARLYNFGAKTAIPGEYIVLFKTKVSLAARVGPNTADAIQPIIEPSDDASAQRLGTAMAESISAHVARVWSIGDIREAMYIQGAADANMRSLASDSRISSIEANLTVFPQTTQTSSSFPFSAPKPPFPIQLARIDQRALPLKDSYTYNTTASSVLVVVPDSGIDVYGDMGNGAQGLDEFCTSMYPTCTATRVLDVHDCVASSDCSFQAYPIPSGYPPGDHPYGDCNGHGSEVTDVAAGNWAGVAKGVMLSATITAYSCNTTGGDIPGNENELAAGIEYYVQRKKSQPNTPYVMIISQSPEAISPVIDNAVQAALNANIAVVVAAGDTDGSTCGWSPEDLAQKTAVISVSAIDANTDERISESATGGCVTLFAPGNPDTGDYPKENCCVSFATPVGTSVAAPVVGGIAALYLSSTPAAPPSEVKAAIVYYATSGALPTSGSGAIGTGSPNLLAYSFVPAGAPPGYVPPPPPGLTQKLKTALINIENQLLNFPNGN